MVDWANIISTVGFPIASFLIAVLGIKYAFDKDREERLELEKRLEDMSKAIINLTQSVSDQTKVLTKCVEKCEGK